MDDIERTLLVKNEVFVYKIPPRTTAKGYRAADWKLDAPEWTGRLRCLEKGGKCELKLEDKTSGQLFAACPVDNYPGLAVEAVTDSSRYFVICIQDSGRKAYIGIGFADRSDSFDLNVTLQDHFKQVKKETQFSKEATEPPKPNLDLAFKEGQTIRINIPNKSTGGATGATSRPKGSNSGIKGGILPPPPGGVTGRLPTSVSGGSLTSVAATANNTVMSSAPAGSTSAVEDLLGDFSSLSTNSNSAQQAPTATSAPPLAPNPSQTQTSSGFTDFDDWGDFAAPTQPSTQTVASGNWETF